MYRNSILGLIFLLPSINTFACMGGLDASYKKYDEKPNYLGHVLCDYNESCNFISLMNENYGAENWEYDENYYIEYPQLFENSSVVPITTGTKNELIAEIYTDLNIIVEGYITVKSGGKNGPKHKETQIVRVAEIKLSKDTTTYYSTRLTFPLPNPVVNIYAVYSNKNKTKAKVAKPPHLGAGINNGCNFNIYLK